MTALIKPAEIVKMMSDLDCLRPSLKYKVKMLEMLKPVGAAIRLCHDEECRVHISEEATALALNHDILETITKIHRITDCLSNDHNIDTAEEKT